MVKRQTKSKVKVGRSDRYPSDYGVRDGEQNGSTEENDGSPR
jgi:hypothetical protein